MFLTEFQFIPAHVGHFQLRVEGHDFTGQKAKAVVRAAFVALFKEGLHAQADAHEELAALDLFLQERDEVEFLQVAHGIADGADAGQFDHIGVADDRRVAGNDGFDTQALPGIIDIGQIANFIIDDCNFHL